MTIYISQLDEPLGDVARPRMSARFYVGYCCDKRDVWKRLDEHKAGRGARMLAAAVARGIDFQIVAVCPGSRATERLIKQRGHFDRTVAQIASGTFVAPAVNR